MKVITTYIAGTKYLNDDGTKRSEILETLILDSDLLIENYYFAGEKAVRVLTRDKRCVGNIPKEYADLVFDYNQKKCVPYIVYKPKYFPNGSMRHNIAIYIKGLI